MAKNPFKVGDRVYVYPHGWGQVMNPRGSDIEIDIDKGSPIYAEPSRVSFTEYDPIKGGLSHERPEDERNEHPKSIIRKMLKRSMVTSLEIERHPGNVVTLNVALAASGDSSKACKGHNWQETLDDAAKRWAKETREDAIGFIGRIKGQDLIAKLESNRRNDTERDTIPVETAERNLKALKYIKKLLKEDYSVVEDFISVEELGDEVQVSLTFRKG